MNREEQVIHLYTVEKKSINRIYKELRCDKKWVSEVLRNSGIELRRKTNWSQAKPKEADMNKFKDLYNQGKNLVEIEKLTGWSYATVKKYLGEEFEGGPKNLTEEQKEHIRFLYDEKELSSREVAEKLGISKYSVIKYAEEVRDPSSYRVHNVNEHFFDEIDTEEKAYWLGYMFADGSNDGKGGKISFSQSERDKGAVYAFRKAIESEHPITPYTAKHESSYKHGSIQYRFQVTSRIMSDALAKYGCVGNKTGGLNYPDIPEKFNHHFIRGVFDGDGSVWTTGGRGCFSITGYIPFLEQVQKVLIAEAGVNNTKLTVRRPDRNPDFGDIRYGGKVPMKQLYDYLYRDARYFLRRKRDKFKEIIEQ